MGFHLYLAGVAEQADAHDSKSCSLGSVGSIPTFGTGGRSFAPHTLLGGIVFFLGVNHDFSE